MLAATSSIISSSTLLAQAYGTGTYSCGPYQVGCNDTTATPAPTAPNTGMLLTEPSFLVPGSLLLAVLLAIITTSIAKVIRRKKQAR